MTQASGCCPEAEAAWVLLQNPTLPALLRLKHALEIESAALVQLG